MNPWDEEPVIACNHGKMIEDAKMDHLNEYARYSSFINILRDKCREIIPHSKIIQSLIDNA